MFQGGLGSWLQSLHQYQEPLVELLGLVHRPSSGPMRLG